MDRRKKKKNDWKDFLLLNQKNIVRVLLIVFAFPVGLYVMWRDECPWKMWVKSLVSVAWLAAIVCAIALLPSVSAFQTQGNVEIIAVKGNRKVLGPTQPEGVPDTAQMVKNASETSSLISQPTPTPDPVMVYCNDNGVYYHLESCRYVYPTTPRVRLAAALNAGKTACPDCKPPNEVTY